MIEQRQQRIALIAGPPLQLAFYILHNIIQTVVIRSFTLLQRIILLKRNLQESFHELLCRQIIELCALDHFSFNDFGASQKAPQNPSASNVRKIVSWVGFAKG